MSENKKPNIQQPPFKLPDLSDINNRIEKGDLNNRSWEKADGKVPDIFDKGHAGLPPEKPTVKK